MFFDCRHGRCRKGVVELWDRLPEVCALGGDVRQQAPCLVASGLLVRQYCSAEDMLAALAHQDSLHALRFATAFEDEVSGPLVFRKFF